MASLNVLIRVDALQIMNKIAALSIYILAGLMFNAIPNNGIAYNWFFIDEGSRLTLQTYVYFHFQHLQVMILSVIMLYDAKKYYKELFVFAFLMLLDWIDYTITGNKAWFEIMQLPISMNVIIVSVFGMVALKRAVKDYKND